ncbi:MAG: ABC transporter permease, partial [Bacteroidales bacterium]|nr:ABC transporter permease [Bacteroidales bacterium]
MKIGIIIKREYLTRVKKRSFLILTLLAPLFFAAIMFLPAILMENSEKFDQKKVIAVRDESELFLGKFENTDFNTFIYIDKDLDEAKTLVKNGEYDGLVYIPGTKLNVPVNAEIYSVRQLPMTLVTHIRATMKNVVEHEKLMASGIDPAVVKAA